MAAQGKLTPKEVAAQCKITPKEVVAQCKLTPKKVAAQGKLTPKEVTAQLPYLSVNLQLICTVQDRVYPYMPTMAYMMPIITMLNGAIRRM